MRVRLLVAIVLLLAPLAISAQGQVTLSGRVLEFGARTGVVAATVLVPGVGQVTTGSNGEFRLPHMAPGPRTVTIAALGYETRELQLNVQRDTSIIIELEVQAVKVDSLHVEARTITVRGSVKDAPTREPVFDADITVGSKSAASNVLGNFRVRGAPAGVAVEVRASAPGFLPYAATITADRDTTLRIELELDPIGQRMLAEQVGRLRTRSQAVNARVQSWNRDVLVRSLGWTLADHIKRHNLVGRPACLFTDDVDKTAWLPDVLNSYMIDEIDRIEAYDRGMMLRIYTRRYIAKQSGRKELRGIVYVRLPGKPMCI